MTAALNDAAGHAVPDSLRMLEISDVAEAFKVSPQTIRRMCERGDFPAPVRLGRRMLWSQRSLERWLEGQREA